MYAQKFILIICLLFCFNLSAEEVSMSNEQAKSCFAVIYRGYLKPGREGEYQKAWQIVTQYFVAHRGAIGSCLHRASDGMWIAYSRWPDQKTRDASWPGENAPADVLPPEVREAILTIQESLDPDRKLPEICMEVVNDLLLGTSYFASCGNDGFIKL